MAGGHSGYIKHSRAIAGVLGLEVAIFVAIRQSKNDRLAFLSNDLRKRYPKVGHRKKLEELTPVKADEIAV
jgi:hypothetical protein